MSYFSKFQDEIFKFDDKSFTLNDLTDVVTNDPIFFFNSAYFQPYYVSPGNRPDIISEELYSDVNYWWTFFIANSITANEWPLDDRELDEWVDKTYSKTEQQLIKRYEDESNNEIPGIALYSFTVDGVPQYHQRDQLINTIGYTRRYSGDDLISIYGGKSVTLYDDLKDINEQRRFIKVIKQEFIENFSVDFSNKLRESIAF